MSFRMLRTVSTCASVDSTELRSSRGRRPRIKPSRSTRPLNRLRRPAEHVNKRLGAVGICVLAQEAGMGAAGQFMTEGWTGHELAIDRNRFGDVVNDHDFAAWLEPFFDTEIW